MSDRERDLQQREQDLAARERQLREQQAAMGTAGARPANNFPPFYPVMYHNIDAEIPVHEQKTVRYLFRSWLILEATVVFNLISCFVLMVSHIEQNWTGTTDFGVSFTYLFTATFGSFFLWYRPVYNAYMKEKSLYYFIYFVFGGLHILFSAYMAAGFYGSGSAGLINTINALSHSAWAAGVFGIINSAAWICQVLFHLYMYKRVYTHYRTQGHTFADAKAQ
ncbi:scamp-domain-containing protein, partial [Ramicandelaber brevisporus]